MAPEDQALLLGMIHAKSKQSRSGMQQSEEKGPADQCFNNASLPSACQHAQDLLPGCLSPCHHASYRVIERAEGVQGRELQGREGKHQEFLTVVPADPAS